MFTTAPVKTHESKSEIADTKEVIVITGASSGIGKETARLFAKTHQGLQCKNPQKCRI